MKTAGNLKKVKFQVLTDTGSRYIQEPCTRSKNSIWFDGVWVNMRKCILSPKARYTLFAKQIFQRKNVFQRNQSKDNKQLYTYYSFIRHLFRRKLFNV